MKCLIVFVVLHLCLISCSGEKEKLTVVDASRDTVFLIKTSKDLTTTINLLIKGYVNDTVMLQGSIKIPGGKINEKLQFDFFPAIGKQCIVE